MKAAIERLLFRKFSVGQRFIASQFCNIPEPAHAPEPGHPTPACPSMIGHNQDSDESSGLEPNSGVATTLTEAAATHLPPKCLENMKNESVQTNLTTNQTDTSLDGDFVSGGISLADSLSNFQSSDSAM